MQSVLAVALSTKAESLPRVRFNSNLYPLLLHLIKEIKAHSRLLYDCCGIIKVASADVCVTLILITFLFANHCLTGYQSLFFYHFLMECAANICGLQYRNP